MRSVPAVLAAGLVAGVLLPASAQAVPDQTHARTSWTRSGTVTLFSATAAERGQLADRQGNWHTVVLSVGEAGISGVAADWTCPDGVQPNFADSGSEWTCTPESIRQLASVTDDDGAPMIRVQTKQKIRRLVVRGPVTVTDETDQVTSGSVLLRGRAVGDRTKAWVYSEDGRTRTVTTVRTQTRARGKVLGVKFRTPKWRVSSSDLVTVTTYTRASARLLPY